MNWFLFAVAVAAFIAATAMTVIAQNQGEYRYAMAGLALMILDGIIVGNLAAAIAGQA